MEVHIIDSDDEHTSKEQDASPQRVSPLLEDVSSPKARPIYCSGAGVRVPDLRIDEQSRAETGGVRTNQGRARVHRSSPRAVLL